MFECWIFRAALRCARRLSIEPMIEENTSAFHGSNAMCLYGALVSQHD